MTRDEPQPPPLCESSEQQNSLHPGEPFTDTLPGTATKGKVGKFWSCGLSFHSPALWIKDLRIGEIAWIVMHHIRAQENQGVRRNAIRWDLVITQHPASHRPRGRIEPHRLRQHHAGVAQLWDIIGGW